jgi:3-methylcrotonyl-CoA carboxylase alpha subunit
MIKKILIANRGEIACRIADTCERLGLAVATIHSDADRDALHVRRIGESARVGGAAAAESYLNIEAIIAAARAVGADAVHPGIGFLSESPLFAQAVEAAGLVFVGPRPETMRRFSDKASAKREAIAAGVPVIEGGTDSWSDAQAVAAHVRSMPLPVLLKAVAGGGGRGVRVVQSLERLDETIESAMREAQASFGLPDLLVEQFIDKPRHIEVQIAGDGKGGVIHIFERECTLQRRFQKVIEEAPAVSLSPALRTAILGAALRLAQRVEYRGLGTMEFLAAGDAFWFLECNPRLQVEHTVTEEICGLDLVELQLRIAASGSLGLAQEEVQAQGYAVQARIYAEDPKAGFMPSAGAIRLLRLPDAGCRVDSGVITGSEVTPHYDAMVAKLVVRGRDRADGLNRLRAAIDQCVLLGVRNNLNFLSRLLDDPRVLANEIDNRFIDRELDGFVAEEAPDGTAIAAAAALWIARWHAGDPKDPWSGHSAWRLDDGVRAAPAVPALLLRQGDREWPIAFASADRQDVVRVAVDGRLHELRLTPGAGDAFQLDVEGRSETLHAVIDEDTIHLQWRRRGLRLEVHPFLSDEAPEEGRSGRLVSPLMGKIIKVNVREGDTVTVDQPLIVLESMKMEIRIDAPHDGVVMSLNCAQGDLVERHALLAVVGVEGGQQEKAE